MTLDKFWFRITTKVLGLEYKGANDHERAIAFSNTKHTDFDIFAANPTDAKTKLQEALKDSASAIKLIGIRPLQCELTLEQMALTLGYMQNKQVQTPQGQMERLDSGLLVPNGVVH